MQRVRFNLKFIHNVSNENFSLLVCYHRNDGSCVLWNFTWDGYHLPDSGVIRGDWAVRLPKHEEESFCRTGYSQWRFTTPDRWSSDLAVFLAGELVQYRWIMKKLVFIFLTLLIVGCGTTRKTVFFERVTPQPLSVIDSLNTVHGLSVPTNLDSWGKTYFIGSDSVMTTVYVLTEKKKDTLFIFSVTETAGKENVIFKFRKE